MGKRGKNREGYHLALLYALELHYRAERRRKGNHPSAWQPLPRKRPEQFARWVAASLPKLTGATPQSANDCLRLLEHAQLGSVSQALEYTLSAWKAARTADGPNSDLRAPEAQASPGDLHPQVRKLAKTLSKSLDQAWRDALEAAERAFAGSTSPSALLLGALPPGFTAISARIFNDLEALEPLGGYRELTASQFYALATGRMPQPPEPMDRPIAHLTSLNEAERELMRTFSEAQLRQLTTVSEQAQELLTWALATYNPVQWHALASAFSSLPSRELQIAHEYLDTLAVMTVGEREKYLASEFRSLKSGNVTLKFLVSHSAKMSTRSVKLLRATDQHTWKSLQQLDPELAGLLAHQPAAKGLRRALSGWDDELLHDASALLNGSSGWAEGYLEDARLVRQLLASRTAAQLDLYELFPHSIARLDAHFQANVEEILLEEVGQAEDEARSVADWCTAQIVEMAA